MRYFYDFVPDLCTTRRPPRPESAHPLGEGRLPRGEGERPDHGQTTARGVFTTIELCTRRSLRPGTRPDARLDEFYDRF